MSDVLISPTSSGLTPPPQSENVDKTLQPKTRIEYFLNKIAENGGSGGGSGGDGILVVGVVITGDGDDTIYTLTKTYREIKNAAFAIIVEEVEYSGTEGGFERFITAVYLLTEQDGLYIVNEKYKTDNIDGYPAVTSNHSF